MPFDEEMHEAAQAETAAVSPAETMEADAPGAPADERPLFDFSYQITEEENREALALFQRKHTFPRCVVYTLIFTALFVFYLDALLKDSSYAAGYLLMAICLGAIAYTWYYPVKMRRQILRALEDIRDDTYVCTLYENRVEIKTVPPPDGNPERQEPLEPTRLVFGVSRLYVVENERMFMLHVKRELIYILPKRRMGDDQIKQAARLFSERLGKQFKALPPKQQL